MGTKLVSRPDQMQALIAIGQKSKRLMSGNERGVGASRPKLRIKNNLEQHG